MRNTDRTASRADRAVSDTLGFVFVFALIMLSVGAVSIAGYDGLRDVRNEERVTNAERAFDVYADNMQDIYRDGAPSRATELKLADASLALGSETRMNVSINNLDGTPSWESSAVKLEPLVYRAGPDTVLVYEAGSVIRVDPSGSVMKNRVGMMFVEDSETGARTAVIPLVQTRATGNRTSLGGTSTVLVRSERSVTEVMADRTNPAGDTVSGGRYEVTFEIRTSPSRAPAWERYLEAEIPPEWDQNDGDVCVVSGGAVTCDIAVDNLYVTATRIDVSLN